MTYARIADMLELTVTPGAGDAATSGYWTVENGSEDVYGLIEKTRHYYDAENYTDGLRWSLHVRVGRKHVIGDSYMAEKTSGDAETLDQALTCIKDVWPTELNDA